MDRMDEHYLNATPVTVSKMKEIIKSLYKSPMARKRAIALVGESSIGKNFIIRQAAEELGVQELWFPSKGILPEDVRGIPIVEDVNGEKRYRFKLLEYIRPAFDKKFKGILHIDEFAQASKDVQAMLYMLLYDRRIDEYYLSDDVMVICSMNPTQEAEYMLSRIQKAAQERLVLFKVVSSVSDWLEWANKNDIDYRVISFVSENPDTMEKNKGRRLHMLSDMLKGVDENDHIMLRAIAQGCLDIDAASRFVAYFEELSEVNAVRLLKGDEAEFERLRNHASSTKLYSRLLTSTVHALKESNVETVFGITKENREKMYNSIAKNMVRMLDILANEGLEIVVTFIKSLTINDIARPLLDAIDAMIEDKPDLRDALMKVLRPDSID